MGLLQVSVIIFIILCALYGISFWAGPKKGDQEKLSTYETGFEPIGDARIKIDIVFWVIGLLYLVFDQELVIILPFASIIFTINSFIGIWAFMLFLIILALGFCYEYFMGALEILTTEQE